MVLAIGRTLSLSVSAPGVLRYSYLHPFQVACWSHISLIYSAHFPSLQQPMEAQPRPLLSNFSKLGLPTVQEISLNGMLAHTAMATSKFRVPLALCLLKVGRVNGIQWPSVVLFIPLWALEPLTLQSQVTPVLTGDYHHDPSLEIKYDISHCHGVIQEDPELFRAYLPPLRSMLY